MKSGRSVIEAKSDANSYEANRALLTETIAGLRRRLRWVHAGTAGFALLGGLVAYVQAVVMVDQAQPDGLPLALRRTLAIGMLLGLMAVIVWFVLRPLLRRISDRYLVQRVEHEHPDFRNSLVTAVEYQDRPDVAGSTIAALLAKAADDIRRFPPEGVIHLRWLKASGWACVVATVLLGLYAWITPIPMVPSIRRALGAAIPAPTGTQIHDLSPVDGHAVVAGRPVRFEALLAGRQPSRVFVEFSHDNPAGWSDVARIDLGPSLSPGLERDGVHRWFGASRPSDLREPVYWRLRAGEAVSDARWLDVRPWPDVDGLSVTLIPPAYTGLPTVEREGGRVEALIGSQVVLRASTNVASVSPTAIFRWADGETRLGLLPDSDRQRVVGGRFRVTGDGTYRIEFTDEFGNANRDPIPHEIRALPDEKPVVSVDRPAEAIELTPTDVLSLSAKAEDDFALTGMRLLVSQGGAERVVGQERLAATRIRTHGYAIEVPVRELTDSAEADLTLRVSAFDNRHDLSGQPAYQEGVSRSLPLRVRAPKRMADASGAAAERDEKAAADRRRMQPDRGSAESRPTSPTGDERVAADDDGERTSPGPEPGPTPSDEPNKPDDLRQWVRDNRDLIERAERMLARADEAADPPDTADSSDQPTSGQDSAAPRSGNGDPQDAPTPRPDTSQADDSTPGNQASDSKPTDSEKSDSPSEQPSPGSSDQSGRGEQSDQSAKTGERESESTQRDKGDPSQGPEPSKAGEHSPAEGGQPAGDRTPAEPNETRESGPSESEPSETHKPNTPESPEPVSPAGREKSSDLSPEQEQKQCAGKQCAGCPSPDCPARKGQSSGEGPSADGPDRGEGQTPGDDRPSPGGKQAAGNWNPADGPGKSASPSSSAPDSAPLPGDEQQPSNRDQGPTLTGRLADVGKAQPLVDEIRRQLRGGEMDDALLEELNWTPKRAAEFVRAYERVIGGQRQTETTPIPTQQRPKVIRVNSDDPVLLGRSMDADVQSAGGQDELPPDQLQDIRRSERQKVSPPYRSLLEAYYQSIGVETTPPARSPDRDN